MNKEAVPLEAEKDEGASCRQLAPADFRTRAKFARKLQQALTEIHYLEVGKPKLEAQVRSMIRLQCTLLGRHLNLDFVRVDVLHLLRTMPDCLIRIGDIEAQTEGGLSLALVVFFDDSSFLTSVLEVIPHAAEPPTVFRRSR